AHVLVVDLGCTGGGGGGVVAGLGIVRPELEGRAVGGGDVVAGAVVDHVHVVVLAAEGHVEAGDADPPDRTVAVHGGVQPIDLHREVVLVPGALSRAGQVGQEERGVVVERPHLLGIGHGDRSPGVGVE